ncbi:hypothetical protein ROS9278_01642 [Roseomonas sp. CECT 9278]|nr:hypothetical protein ROS9278_01642 [Roseomonas sp. CECT 9278]
MPAHQDAPVASARPPATANRIVPLHDPRARSATAPNPQAAAHAPVPGAQAKPAHAGARRLRA